MPQRCLLRPAELMRAPNQASPRGSGASPRGPNLPDFSSDVGRIKFGFSHEEIDDSTAYYEGQFKLYQRCGEGTLHCPETGAKYVGQFQADRAHGLGDQTWSDGSTYKGQWKNGQKNGNGVYVGVDNLKYDGQWEDGRRHGLGTQEYANGDKYRGWWCQGMCSGPGSYIFPNGCRYEGAWANGRYDGPGVLYSSDGSRERQWHSNGLLIKREMLPKGEAPKSDTAPRRAIISRPLWGQARDDMHKPTTLPKPHPSKYLIRRETAGMDLSASPLRPKTALAGPGSGLDSALGMYDIRPSTAGGDSFVTGLSDLATDTPGTAMFSGRGGTSGGCTNKEFDALDHEIERRGGHYSA